MLRPMVIPGRGGVCSPSNLRLLALSQAEQADEPHYDEIHRNDVIEHPWHDEDEDAGQDRYQGRETEGDVHWTPFLKKGIFIHDRRELRSPAHGRARGTRIGCCAMRTSTERMQTLAGC